MNTAPPRGKAWFVNIAGWIWVENWGPTVYHGEVSTRTADVTATPITFTFDPADGSPPIVCRGPGTPWTYETSPTDPGRCAHTYQRSTNHRQLPATVTITYHLTWTSNDGSVGDAGTRQSPPTPLPIQVDQIVSVGTK